MIPDRKDLTLTRGDYFEMYLRFRTQVWDEDAGDDGEGAYVDGPYRDLTGVSFLGQIRNQPDTELLASFDFQIFDQTDPDTKGAVLVTLSGSVAATLPVGKHKYDIQQTIDGKPETFVGGSAKVLADVSRPVTP